jgi:hypothetical protein
MDRTLVAAFVHLTLVSVSGNVFTHVPQLLSDTCNNPVHSGIAVDGANQR